ncbi:uncharacterized protein LOC115742012 [Rhodamnia argentea]|uniref:Uncharacterized protein LOC115742012 n=1 Tax=Rhodamnia argentea TaxID=178133 RepID=A0A8B8PAT7_9MYRT|nr:uncharacterized protein LOC115742012 [Rhodamnia argentea]
MEGLIPFVYRAIVQYRNGNQGLLATWFPESPSASYMRLPGDSGRLQASDIHLFRPDCSFNDPTSTPPPTATGTAATATVTTSTTQVIVSSGVQSPIYRLSTRRIVA